MNQIGEFHFTESSSYLPTHPQRLGYFYYKHKDVIINIIKTTKQVEVKWFVDRLMSRTFWSQHTHERADGAVTNQRT